MTGRDTKSNALWNTTGIVCFSQFNTHFVHSHISSFRNYHDIRDSDFMQFQFNYDLRKVTAFDPEKEAGVREILCLGFYYGSTSHHYSYRAISTSILPPDVQFPTGSEIMVFCQSIDANHGVLTPDTDNDKQNKGTIIGYLDKALVPISKSKGSESGSQASEEVPRLITFLGSDLECVYL